MGDHKSGPGPGPGSHKLIRVGSLAAISNNSI